MVATTQASILPQALVLFCLLNITIPTQTKVAHPEAKTQRCSLSAILIFVIDSS